jgi:hypothetical protein
MLTGSPGKKSDRVPYVWNMAGSDDQSLHGGIGGQQRMLPQQKRHQEALYILSRWRWLVITHRRPAGVADE